MTTTEPAPAKPAKAKPTRYSITLPDGVVVTRTSPRTYTHASAVRHPVTLGWYCQGFAGSEELARKAAASAAARWAKSRPGHPGHVAETRVIPVEIATGR